MSVCVCVCVCVCACVRVVLGMQVPSWYVKQISVQCLMSVFTSSCTRVPCLTGPAVPNMLMEYRGQHRFANKRGICARFIVVRLFCFDNDHFHEIKCMLVFVYYYYYFLFNIFSLISEILSFNAIGYDTG